MLNYQKTAQAFDLKTVANHLLSGSIDALNACYECCDRYADSERIALYWYGKDGRKEQYTLICAELAGDFHLGYARQLTDKSSLLFDLAF